MPIKYHTAGDVHHIKSIKTHVYLHFLGCICHISTKQHIVKLSVIIRIGSMYAIYGNIYHQHTPNVSIYTIHGSYGIIKSNKSMVMWDRMHHLSPECASLNLQPGRLPPGTAGSGSALKLREI